MAGRVTLAVGILLLGTWTVESLARQPTGVGQAVRPTRTQPVSGNPKEPSLSVSQTILSADKGLTRLEEQNTVDFDYAELRAVERSIELVDEKDPSNPWLLYLKGRVLTLKGRASDASIKLMQFVQTRRGATQWRAFRLLGDFYVAEYPRLAESNYEKAAALNPNEPSVLYGLSVCAMKRGEIADAVTLAQQAVAFDGRHTIRYIAYLATALQAAGEWDGALREAEQALKLALERSKNDTASRDGLLVVDTQHRLLRSILLARIATPMVDVVDDYLRLATCVRQHNEVTYKLGLHELLRIFEAKIAATAPNVSFEILKQYGYLLDEVGRSADAIEVLQRVAEIDPKNAAAANRLARLRAEVASPDQAK